MESSLSESSINSSKEMSRLGLPNPNAVGAHHLVRPSNSEQLASHAAGSQMLQQMTRLPWASDFGLHAAWFDCLYDGKMPSFGFWFLLFSLLNTFPFPLEGWDLLILLTVPTSQSGLNHIVIVIWIHLVPFFLGKMLLFVIFFEKANLITSHLFPFSH